MPVSLSRKIYADMYGPTTGDKVRLADTELFLEFPAYKYDSLRSLSKFLKVSCEVHNLFFHFFLLF